MASEARAAPGAGEARKAWPKVEPVLAGPASAHASEGAPGSGVIGPDALASQHALAVSERQGAGAPSAAGSAVIPAQQPPPDANATPAEEASPIAKRARSAKPAIRRRRGMWIG